MATYYLPDNLNLAKLLEEHPPTNIQDFKIEHLIYIIHLVITLPSSNKGVLTSDDFVPINASILQNKVRFYAQYFNYLIENDILVSDNRYIKGVKSIGYKLKPPYNTNIIAVNHETKQADRLSKRPGMPIAMRRRYKHVIKWFNEDFRIDKKAALEFIEVELQRKLNDPTARDYDYTKKSFKDPWQQYRCAKIQIERLATGDYPVSIDDNVSRLHSPLTNLSSELRSFLSYDGSPLICFDIANCQPFLAAILFNISFWEGFDSNTRVSIHDLPYSYSPSFIHGISSYIKYNISNCYFSSSSSCSSFIRERKNGKENRKGDLELYIELVSNGKIYEYFKEQILQKDRLSLAAKEVKPIVFQTFFTDNRFFGQKEAQPKRLFESNFPTVYGLFSLIKRKDKTMLPKLLQRFESYLILDVVTRRIASIDIDVPIFTIHDSIVTTAEYGVFVMNTMVSELEKSLGLKPTIATQRWHCDFEITR